MPRNTKDQKNIKKEETLPKNKIKKEKNDILSNFKKTNKKTNVTKSTSKKQDTKSATKNQNVKSTNTTKDIIKKTNSNKTTSTVKKTTANTSNTAISKETKKEIPKSKFAEIVEYYDLPYRYNQTVVKLLAQTPDTLFIYWDISDTDRENLKKHYGFDFFHKTRPILIIHNDTMNYSFEVEIDDFANSWYLHVNDSNCNYRIELGRRPIPNYEEIPSFQHFTSEEIIEIDKFPPKQIDKDYFYITTSNSLTSPNDHILVNNKISEIQIRNVKTNEQYNKSISSLTLKNNISKIYNIYDLYKKLYKEENIEDIFDLSNPSSGNPSSKSFSSQFK